ncbi:MAG TPA: hypothetical protein VF644_08900 [Pyrinomonadaceae bacterium]
MKKKARKFSQFRAFFFETLPHFSARLLFKPLSAIFLQLANVALAGGRLSTQRANLAFDRMSNRKRFSKLDNFTDLSNNSGSSLSFKLFDSKALVNSHVK